MKIKMHGVDKFLHTCLAGAAHVFAAFADSFGLYHLELSCERLDGFHACLAVVFVGDEYKKHYHHTKNFAPVLDKEVGRQHATAYSVEKQR